MAASGTEVATIVRGGLRLSELALRAGAARLRALPAPENLADAGANAFDLYLGDGLVKLNPTSSAVIDEAPQRTIRRYLQSNGHGPRRGPVLLIPPLAGPIACFDLHRRRSLAQHLLRRGYDTYVVDYGPIAFEQRELGLEHWVRTVIPDAVRSVSEHSGGQDVHAVGWCLGGLMLGLVAAEQERLPMRSVTMVAAPFDMSRMSMLAPLRFLGELTGGRVGSAFYRTLGGIPAPLVSAGFRLTAIDRYVTKPLFLARRLHDREALEHATAIDRYMSQMLAYPGRTIGQLYHQFFRSNDLASGRVVLDGKEIDLFRLQLPALVVAGEDDIIAPPASVLHARNVLAGARELRVRKAPGGHLGVLTGTAAPDTTWTYLDEFLAAHT